MREDEAHQRIAGQEGRQEGRRSRGRSQEGQGRGRSRQKDSLQGQDQRRQSRPQKAKQGKDKEAYLFVKILDPLSFCAKLPLKGRGSESSIISQVTTVL